jgi:undecaprenyl-diphosphatase
MTRWQAHLAGHRAGLGEFLPISSSGHLIVVPWLLGWPVQSLAFDVALHVGTLVAVLAAFAGDWWRPLRRACARSAQRGSAPEARTLLLTSWLHPRRHRWPAARRVGGDGVPGARARRHHHGVMGACSTWPIGARPRGRRHRLGDLAARRAADRIRARPGARAGRVAVGRHHQHGLLLGHRRQEAARFSFLLATPIHRGRGAAQGPAPLHEARPGLVVPGMIAAAVVGCSASACCSATCAPATTARFAY